jgi:hypothetical protein
MSLHTRWAPSIFVSACLLAVVAPGAHAAPVVIPVGASNIFSDPGGSGRTASAQFSGGSSTIAFSQGPDFDSSDPAVSLGGAMAVLNAAQMAIRSTAPVTWMEQSITDPWDGSNVRVNASIGATAASVFVDPNTSAITQVAVGGTFGFEAPVVHGAHGGGNVTISNVRFDLARKQIVADLNGLRNPMPGVASQSFSQVDAALWTYDTISGVEAFPVATWFGPSPKGALEQAGYSVKETLVTTTEVVGYTPGGYYNCPSYGYGYGYGYGGGGGCSYAAPQPIFGQSAAYEITGTTLLTGLKLTQDGLDFISHSFGFRPTMVAAFQGVGDFGTVTLKTSFTVAVPEPQTYALMAMGLVLMAGAVRRHRRANV